jgi:Predicted endonuclease distantly related to archaeal Holliday junction resolvase
MSSSRPCAFHHSRTNRIIVWLLAFCLSVMPLLACADPMPLIPIQTGAESMGCSASGTGSSSSASPAPHIDSGGSNLICTVHGKKEAPKSLATRILEFAEGFAKGFVNGLWDQITGFWGLIMHAGSILKFGETLAEHPTRTWHLLEATLGKKGAQVLHDLTNPQKIKQQLICEPYSSGKMAGNTVETVVSFLVPGVGEAGDGVKVADELDHVVELVDDSEKVAAEDGGKAASKINPCKLADGAGGSMACAVGGGGGEGEGTKVVQIVTTDDAEQVGEDIANGKTVIVQNLKSLSNKRIGDLGEGYAIGELKKAGYDHVVQIQNASGHGVDIIAHDSSTDEVRVIEVKTTKGDKAPGLSEYQKEGAEKYTQDRLDLAEEGRYAPTTTKAQATAAKGWIAKAKAAGKLHYEVQPVFLRQGDDGVVAARLGPSRTWP